jgi:hypothetical protein
VVFLFSLSTILLLDIGAVPVGTAPISNNNIVERENKITTLLEQLQYLITTS